MIAAWRVENRTGGARGCLCRGSVTFAVLVFSAVAG